MGLADTVRSGVALANSLTGDLQDAVTHERWINDSERGRPVYAAGVSLQALVEYKERRVVAANGDVSVQRAKITIIGPVSALPAGQHTAKSQLYRKDPIDPRDRFTLPNGTVARILNIVGLDDPSTGSPYLYEVTLGERQ